MITKRKYLVAVALLAVLAVAFGVLGTVAPPLAEESTRIQPQQESSSESVGHFQNPPTYDSGWVDISTKAGQYVTLRHGLNTSEVVVDITGKQSLDTNGGALAWSKTYGGGNADRAQQVIQTGDGGYALAGYTYTDLYGSDFWLVKTDSGGNHQWNRTYFGGGASSDYAYSLVQTGDGGYAIAGYTDYWQSAGGYDFWLVKTESSGDVLWSQTYGGATADTASSVIQTSDGGYAVAGSTQSFGAGLSDFWLVKTDSAGNALWNRTYGGASSDYGYSVVQISDGGYALAGYTTSYGAGNEDFWLIKTYANGTMEWNRTYGGASRDYGYSLVQTSDGGYALAGSTNSYGAGGSDFWLVKTDSTGNHLWNETYGGLNTDAARSVVQTGDGGYALAGETFSYGAGSVDMGLVKVKPEMNVEHQRNLGGTGIHTGWSRTYGGTHSDQAYSLVQTSDGGYAIAGYFNYWSGTVNDFWLVKTDSGGNPLVNKTYDNNGDWYDRAYSLVQTNDGGYALAGSTGPTGYRNVWLVKTDSAGNHLWNQTYYGVAGDDVAWSLVQTGDGGYALAGHTDSDGYGFWLVKTDSTGNVLWNKTYAGDTAYSLVQTSDGGYALAGYTYTFEGGYDFWVVKTDSTGTLQWNKTYTRGSDDYAYSLVQTSDGGYMVAGRQGWPSDAWLIKIDSAGNEEWNRTYGGPSHDVAWSLVQTSDGGYALAGTYSYSADNWDFWLVKTDSAGNVAWSQTYGGASGDYAYSLVQTSDGGYALAGYTTSYGAGLEDFWLVKADVELGLTRTALTNNTITLYRGRTDLDWNYVRVRIWKIKEPTWIYGDINQDGIVDAKDLAIIGRNYGKTFSALSLGGIAAIAGIYIYKKRKQPK